MKTELVAAVALAAVYLVMPTGSAPAVAAASVRGEAKANSQEFPTQILKSGVVLNSNVVSPNALQLANIIGVRELLMQIEEQRNSVDLSKDPLTFEELIAQQKLEKSIQKAMWIIEQTNLEIDFTASEIDAEDEVYQEILAKFTSDRDKLVARVNAASFISNGILWAACEAMSIPSINTTFANNPRRQVQWPIPSGITGIAAGIIPSIASMYTLKAVNGKTKTSEAEPNMLAKVFGYPTNPEIEYPPSVWQFLNQVPADTPGAKKRIDQVIDRWIADANIPAFTDRSSNTQLEILTGSVAHRKGLSISTLNARSVMLHQLQCEIVKMKRLLLDLSMAVLGQKRLPA